MIQNHDCVQFFILSKIIICLYDIFFSFRYSPSTQHVITSLNE